MEASAQNIELDREMVGNPEHIQQLEDPSSFPAVIVEQVPHSHLLTYSGLVCDQQLTHLETLDHDTGEDVPLTVEAFQSGEEDTMETIEAAEALLNMDSPSSLSLTLDEKHLSHIFLSDVFTNPVNQVSLLSDGLQGQPQWLQLQRNVEVETVTQQPKTKKGRKPRRQRTRSPIPDINIKKSKDGRGNTLYLWEFLMALLQDRKACPRYIKWTNREKGIFKLVDSKAVSQLWGKHKNKPDMNYETMGRALRYYYQRGILNKVEGQRLVYQFAELPKDMVYITDDEDDDGGGGDSDMQHEVDQDDEDDDDEDDSGDSDDDVDNEEVSSDQESLKKPTVITPSRLSIPATKPSARGAKAPVRRKAVNGGQRAPKAVSGTAANKTGRTLGLIQQQHLPIVSAEMLRTLQNVQSLQPGRHGSVFRTAQLLGNLRQKQENTGAHQQGTLIQAQAQTQIQSLSQQDNQTENPATQIVTLQLVPVGPTVDASGNLIASPHLLMQQVPSDEQLTLVVESMGDNQTADLLQTETPVQTVLPDATSPATSTVPATATLTVVSAGGQQLVSQPAGTVIHSVTATEPEQNLLSDDQGKEAQGRLLATETTSDALQGTDTGEDSEGQPKVKMEPLSVMIINDSWVGYNSSN